MRCARRTRLTQGGDAYSVGVSCCVSILLPDSRSSLSFFLLCPASSIPSSRKPSFESRQECTSHPSFQIPTQRSTMAPTVSNRKNHELSVS